MTSHQTGKHFRGIKEMHITSFAVSEPIPPPGLLQPVTEIHALSQRLCRQTLCSNT